MRQLLVVQPDPLGPLGRFGDWLTDAGLALRVVRPFDGETLPETLEEDGLLVLGGRMSAGDDDEHPWLADVRSLLRDAVNRSDPVLGICLGAQLLAQSFGGTVTVGDRGLETGVVPIHWRSESRGDALFADMPSPFLTGTAHFDVITALPETAAWLGYSAMYPHQAFRVGPRGWGVQFHPEASADGYRRWAAFVSAEADAVVTEKLRHGTAEFQRLDDAAAAGASLLARRFADLVLTRADRHR